MDESITRRHPFESGWIDGNGNGNGTDGLPPAQATAAAFSGPPHNQQLAPPGSPPPAVYSSAEIAMHVAPGASKAELLRAIHFLASLHWHGAPI